MKAETHFNKYWIEQRRRIRREAWTAFGISVLLVLVMGALLLVAALQITVEGAQ